MLSRDGALSVPAQPRALSRDDDLCPSSEYRGVPDVVAENLGKPKHRTSAGRRPAARFWPPIPVNSCGQAVLKSF